MCVHGSHGTWASQSDMRTCVRVLLTPHSSVQHSPAVLIGQPAGMHTQQNSQSHRNSGLKGDQHQDSPQAARRWGWMGVAQDVRTMWLAADADGHMYSPATRCKEGGSNEWALIDSNRPTSADTTSYSQFNGATQTHNHSHVCNHSFKLFVITDVAASSV